MASLEAAHRGYEYQDLLVAARLVDMLLGSVLQVHVDEKLFPDDRFDDLTTVGIAGHRERSQFKHTEDGDRPLTLDTFTSDRRGLRLDGVIAAMLADRSGPGCTASELTFRIVLRDKPPDDPRLRAVLTPPRHDPGPFLLDMKTVRFSFDAVELWKQPTDKSGRTGGDPFRFLFGKEMALKFDELEWVCQHLVIELGAPPASGDLTAPDVAERLLLTRVRAEVGAGAFPNVERSAIDVAAAMISTARAARQGRVVVTAQELLRRAQLRSDFGAVSRAHPVDPALEVLRRSTVDQLVEAATELATRGGHLLVVGPPGHGKSWVCQQFMEALSDAGWLTAEHYCYLGDADGERLERVLAEAVFGSLLGRLAEADPRLATSLRPRFAADEDALIDCVESSLRIEPSRRIALVIDGIDHITRVRARTGNRFDPSRGLAEALSSRHLPSGSVVITLSQPGAHLEPLEQTGAKIAAIPGLDTCELASLAARLNVLPGNGITSATGPLLKDPGSITDFLDALAERSTGNALYATYLCREVLKVADTLVDAADTVRCLPPFDGTLKNYYDHLYSALDAEAAWVADVIALIDFSVTREELRQIRPDAAHRVDAALTVLKPVLMERATQGGVRVYHESFARYLRSFFQDGGDAVQALIERIANWLANKGLFVDPRAFRSLLAILAEAGRDNTIVDLVDQMFVTRAVAAGFPSSGINANLATAIGSAARLGDWAAVVRYVELSRAAEAYQSERFESTLVAFADVPASLLGADVLAARLLDDDRVLMPARAGLQMCAAVDALGATAPWRAYMTGYLREARADTTSYGDESNRAVAIAWLRGRLRLAGSGPGIGSRDHSAYADADARAPIGAGPIPEEERDVTSPIHWRSLADWIENLRLPAPEVIRTVDETQGFEGVVRLIESLRSPGDACLALAERLAREPASGDGNRSPYTWAREASTHGISSGSIHRLLRLGVDAAQLAHDTIAVARERLLDLTRRVQERLVRSEDGHVGAWLDACAIAAHRDKFGMNATEALVAGEGWYRCWLRFALALSSAEAAEPGRRGSLALDALRLLTGDLRPFSGDPRSCDLFSLHGAIRDTIRRAMDLLDDEQWETGLGVLVRVSSSITTTLFGELGGPVPPDYVLRLAVEGASRARRRAAEALIEDEIARGSARRFYADLAEYRLLGARLALAANDRDRAEALWHEACGFLTAYGWHKDVTIYEVLDPLPVLIMADPVRARVCVAAVQGLCERVPLHTDLKETRYAWRRWWELLAQADPVAAVHLAVPQLLGECNDPNQILHGALEDVWLQWHERVDPVLAGVLRLTLDTPLGPADVKQLKRLEEAVTSNDAVRELMSWLLARADERPVTYSSTDSSDLLARDNEVVAELNRIAERANLPRVVTVQEDGASASGRAPSRDTRASSRSSIPAADAMPHLLLPRGSPGLSRAIRTWGRLPYEAWSEWAVERFAAAIGYRLLELAAEGRHDEAASALRLLAGQSRLGDRASILRSVAEGLERHGEFRLAATAYALAWTRTRAHGGWLAFGGETEINALRRASTLDCSVTCAVVTEEIQQIVAAGHSSYGISQAVVHAFAAGALSCQNRPTTDMAFAAWREAFSVISQRAPRVDVSEEPDNAYSPPNPDTGEAAPGDLDAALALAALGALGHPGREKKRRALLAAQLLLAERPGVAALPFDIALGAISDPGTLTWLLCLVGASGERSAPVRAACQRTLRQLVSRGMITVRALARRLLIGDEPPLAPPTPAEDALLRRSDQTLWTPGETEGPNESTDDRLLQSVAGTRLRQGERLLPGLEAAVRARATASLQDERARKRLRSQLDAFADSARSQWPDAYLAPEQAIEEALQSVATGGRAALLMAGNPMTDPIAWEDRLASALLDDPSVPLALEARRQPRPWLAPPPGSGHELWARILERAAGGSRATVQEASADGGLLRATLSIEPAGSAPTVEGWTFGGWRWLGTMETRAVKHPSKRNEPDLVVKRFYALEVRDVDDYQALTLPPVASGDLRMWRADVDQRFVPRFDASQPLVGVDRQLTMAGDAHRGLGVPDSLLVPTVPLIALLNLHPGAPCIYEDGRGVALALVTWRAEYDVSDYYLAWPRTSGSGIVIRPDLFDRLVAAAGEHRLVLRDFIIGDLQLRFMDTASKAGGP